MKLTSFDQIHNRNYHKEKQEKAGIKSKGFFERLRETSFDSPLLAATGVAVFEAARQSSSYVSTSKLGIDSVYGSIRKLENRLPLFNIPLRTSQLGDLMSPFVSGQALKWEFAGSELFSKNGSLREDFKFLNEIVGRDLSQELKSPDSRIFFEKKGSVYGDIFLERGGSKKTLVEDVFMMQRPSSKTGAISQIWDAGKRPTNFYKPLSEEWDKAFTSLGFSAETAKKMRFAGGVMRTIVGETTHEFFKGMNRFLKEPIPGINKLLDWSHDSIQLSQKIEELGETGLPLKRLFGNIGAVSTEKADSLGRLPRWLRPYISEGYWTKNAGRMAVALAAKGTMFTTVLPSMYGALDYARAKMEGTPAPVSGALFGAVGFGIGGLIKSRDFDRGIFKGTKFLTKTQLAGGLAGAAIGVLPIFDKGISAGFGSLYGSLNIIGSRAWETIGGQKAREKQEGLFPGITNPMTGVGFVMGGGFVGYFNSEIGTSKALLQSLSGRALDISGRTQESILSSIASGNVSDLLTSDITEAFRKEQTGKVFSIRDAAKVLRGESKEASTITGLVARSYQSLYEKGDVPEEFIKRMSTVEGSEELASRLFTHLDDLSSTIHKANKNLDPDYLLKGPLGRTFDRMKDVLQGRPSFTRGALKGGLAFLGVSQLGAVAAGAMGGDLNPVNLIPGWLISLTGGGASSKETEEVFTGKKEVAIRKGRWWSLGSCLSENAKLYVNQLGDKISAKDIKVNQLILNSEGTQSKVLQIWKRKYSGQIYKIYTNDYENPLIITGNHIVPYLEFCGNEKIKKYRSSKFGRIDELKVKDAVRLPNLLSDEIQEYKRFGDYALNEDLGYLLGVYLAEGATSQNKRLDFTHNINEEYIYQQLEYVCKNLGLSYKLKIKNNTAKSLIFNTKFTKLVSESIYIDYKADSTVYGKCIPDAIFNSPTTVQLSFLKGWMDGDGYQKGNTSVIKTVSSNLKNQLIDLAYKLDLVARASFETINKYFDPKTKQYVSCETHKIYIIRLSLSGHPHGICFENDHKYISIRKIETEYYDGDVYDFEIDHKDHLLVSNFMIHNSPWEGTKVAYHRLHRSVLMQSDAETNALYGSWDEKIAYDPVLHPLRNLIDDEFKYHRDMRLSEISPTPQSSRMFSDVPILGDLLAATVGEVIKPTRNIRASEWKNGSAVIAPSGDDRFHDMRSAPAVESLGGLGYTARDLTSMQSVTRDTFKRMTEQAGLRGFIFGNSLSTLGYEERTYDPVIERGDSLLSARAKFWSLNLGDPMGACFTGDALVSTIKGRKPIKEVRPEELVLSLDGRYRKVKGKLVVKNHNKQLIKIKASTVGTEFVCTENHWIPVLKRDYYSNGHAKPIKDIDLVDTQAKDIKLGDYLVIPIIADIGSLGEYIRLTDNESQWLYWDQVSPEYIRAYELHEDDPSFWNRKRLKEAFGDGLAKAVIARRNKGNIRRCPNHIKITKDLLYWLGWYTAEGCADKYRITFTLGSHEQEYAERLQNIADKELGLGRGELKNNGSSIRLRFSNKYLVNFLNEQFGKGAKNKRIPEWIKLQDKKLLASYLSGLLIGDGWSKGFTSSSKDLALDVFQCLLRLNVRGNLTLDYIEKSKGAYPQGTPRKETRRHNYRAANSHIERFQEVLNEQVPEEIEELGGKSFITDGKLYVQVRGVELLDTNEPVYDLEIEDLHYYVVEEIAVHNTEAARRYLTKDRNTYYNPLSNMAPSWLPENNYWLDFRHGNYFNKVQEGWLRLPGAGYEELNPELKGLHPENYSVGHKYKILSDVAYGSNEYLMAKEKAKQAITSGNISKRDLQLIETANKHLGEKKIKRSFRDYQFERPMSKEQEFTVMGVADDGSIITAETGKRQLKLAGLNMSMAAFTRKKLEEENFKTIADAERAGAEARANAISELRDKLRPGTKIKGHIPIGDDAYSGAETELYIPSLNESIKGLGAEVDKDSTFSSSIKYNAAQRFLGGLWEKYTHNADLPITPAMAFNKIAPFQPHAKFIKRLTPIELYAQTRVYGRELQMWQNYKSDFIDTAINDVRSKVSGDFIPNKVAYQRTMVEYFDKLKWLKFHMLEQASSLHDNSELSEYYAQKKKQTMYGADPYRGYTDIFRALPGTERDFYREFVEESDPTNQERILELAPDPMKRIYIAQWQNKRIKALGHKAEAGIASQTEKTELKNLYKLRESEGFINNSELKQQYENEARGTDISYADWVRMKELKEYFKAFKLPKANYVGFDPRVDLEDVKLKVAQTDGIDIHDIGLWDQQAASISRKPYVDAGASLLQDWHEPGQNEIEFEAQIRRTIRELGSKLHLTPVPGQQNKVLLSTMDTREHEIRNHLKRGVF